MGVHVADGVGRLAGVLQAGLHGLDGTQSLRLGRGDVVRVPRGSVAGQLRVDPSPPRHRPLRLFQDERTGAFGQHEAVPVAIEWPAGVCRIVVATRERLHLRESGQGETEDRGVGPTGDADLGEAVADHSVRVANGVGPGGAGRRDALVRTGEAERHGHVSRGGVRHEHRNHERTDSVRSFLQEHLVLDEEAAQPADPGREHDPGPGVVDRGIPGVLPRQLRRGDGEVDRPVGSLDLLGTHPCLGVEVVDLPGDLDGQL